MEVRAADGAFYLKGNITINLNSFQVTRYKLTIGSLVIGSLVWAHSLATAFSKLLN